MTSALVAGAASMSSWMACSAAPVPVEPPAVVATPPAIATQAAPSVGNRRRGHTLLAELHEAPLPFVLQAASAGGAAGGSVLAIAAEGDGATWVRRVDARGPTRDAPSPLVRLIDEHFVGAFDRSDGGVTWVTSDGDRLCFGNAPGGAQRTCIEASPSAIVPVGDRLALLEAHRVPTPGGAAHTKPKSPASKDAKPSDSKARHRSGHGSKPKREHAHTAPSRAVSHPIVEIGVRWVEPDGAVSEEATPTDLHFEAPLDGMTLVDARPRAPGIDLLWYETAPKRKTRSPLGSGRLMAGSLRPDGRLDFASRVAVVDADLEFGQLKDHRAPRLIGADAPRILMLDGKGACEALVVRSGSVHPVSATASTCAVAADRLGAEKPGESDAFARILSDDPRRAFGQPKTDVGLVAWAGDRGFYLHGTSLRSASSRDGEPREERSPFPARRASIAWGAIASDGDAIASVDGDLVRVAPVGSQQRARSVAALGAPELAVDRRRAARIGSTWWLARGARARLFPEPVLATTPFVDTETAVLVGGASRGLSIEVSAGALRVSLVDEAGALTATGVTTPSPILLGFDACERATGGALVAGVSRGASAGAGGQVVAFVVDGNGRPGVARAVPLPLVAGQLAMRLLPLPAGGALLMDLARRHVVWLDDEARALGDAALPPEASLGPCPYGRPMPLKVPGMTPGQLVDVPEAAEGACIVGDAVWTRDGSLRWLGGTTEGLDFSPEIAALPLTAALSLPIPEDVAPLSKVASATAPVTGPRACPPEMVSVNGRFCVDRFEATVVDARTGLPLSPDYPTTPNLLDAVLTEWATGRERSGSVHARAFPLPWIAPSRLGDRPAPLAVSRFGARPNGYLTGVVAAQACTAAGKRLCSLDEFVTACRGEADTPFPYGESYVDGTCNVFRDEHPAALLHGNASVGHLDPRLNRVRSRGRPLLQATGESPACRSRWGDDAIYDMVGNLDEWVEEGAGAFAGGFYSRSTRSGCDAVVTAHPKTYLDYSTGVRCCRDP